MGGVCKLVDALLFVFFVVIALAAPLIDAQTCIHIDLFPKLLIDLKNWYSQQYNDYLVVEKPDFLVGLVWVELLFQWPLSLINIYGILGSKSWFKTTSLIYGVSCVTSMAAILGEVKGSGKGSDELIMVYVPFLGFGVLAILRGLLPSSSSSSSSSTSKNSVTLGKRTALPRKKMG